MCLGRAASDASCALPFAGGERRYAAYRRHSREQVGSTIVKILGRTVGPKMRAEAIYSQNIFAQHNLNIRKV